MRVTAFVLSVTLSDVTPGDEPIAYPGLPAPEQYYAPAYFPPPPQVEPRTSRLAVAAAVVAVASAATLMCTFGVPAVVAVLLGHLAFLPTAKGRMQGRWLAWVALVLGYAVLAIAVAVWVDIARTG